MKAVSATMAKHIEELCAVHQIQIGNHSRGGKAFRKVRRIDIRPVKSAVTYAVALHEIGHLLGKQQSRSCLEREVGAWQWAKEAALCWDSRMEEQMRLCLVSYYRAACRRKRMVMPGPDHDFWRMARIDASKMTFK